MIENYLEMSAYSCTVISELFGTIASLKNMVKILDKQSTDYKELIADLDEEISEKEKTIQLLNEELSLYREQDAKEVPHD
jgi:prefoldin subunit 5